MSNKFWTSEKIQVVRSLWLHKRSWEIGNEIGCTGCAVIGKARRLGLPQIDRRTAGARQSLTNREKKAYFRSPGAMTLANSAPTDL